MMPARAEREVVIPPALGDHSNISFSIVFGDQKAIHAL